MSALPEPAAQPVAGHLGRFGREPLALFEEGAALGDPFALRLWRRAVVGYGPDWNRLVLGDLDTFRSRGSLSAMSPYLAGGVVLTDAPEHAPRRAELNPHLHARALEPLRERIALAVRERLPGERFDALAWSLELIPVLLNEAFFAGRFPAGLLTRFLAPLHHGLPAPLLPRPLRFRAMDAALARALRRPSPDALVAHLAHLDDAVEEVRIALAAGFDTTAHTLAWALWHLAADAPATDADGLPALVKETLRLHPAGWLGSRVAARPFAFRGREFPAGRLVFYSPYLTHRDPALWPEPLRFDPGRFDARPPAWGYVPFAAGERICLGMHLAQLMLREAIAPFLGRGPRALSGDTGVRVGLTVSPRGPLRLAWDG